MGADEACVSRYAVWRGGIGVKLRRIDGSRQKLEDALEESYAQNGGDEFVRPLVCGDYAGFAEGDALFFTNFRDDRMLQLAMYCALMEIYQLS